MAGVSLSRLAWERVATVASVEADESGEALAHEAP